jgi:hypothetical protein
MFLSLNSDPVEIPKDKWKDLQGIKPVLLHDCHNYYALPYADISYRQTKAKKKKLTKLQNWDSNYYWLNLFKCVQ